MKPSICLVNIQRHGLMTLKDINKSEIYPPSKKYKLVKDHPPLNEINPPLAKSLNSPLVITLENVINVVPEFLKNINYNLNIYNCNDVNEVENIDKLIKKLKLKYDQVILLMSYHNCDLCTKNFFKKIDSTGCSLYFDNSLEHIQYDFNTIKQFFDWLLPLVDNKHSFKYLIGSELESTTPDYCISIKNSFFVFESFIYNSNINNGLLDKSNDKKLFSKNKKYEYLCLNNKPKPARGYLLNYLFENNLDSKGIISARFNLNKERHNYLNSRFLNSVPINLPDDYEKNYQKTFVSNDRYINRKWFEESKFSIVTETIFYEDTVFLTEKTLKPIMYGHPFIILSTPNTLKYLQSKGYETFDDIFDESYDNELDHDKRFKKVCDLIYDTIKNIDDLDYDLMFKKVIHNRERYLNSDNQVAEINELIHTILPKNVN